METLIPDFRGITDQIDRLIEAAPEVVSHNMETVRRLTRQVRIQAQYDRSLEVLRYLKANGVNRTKTGIMLGLGETEDELYQTLDDVRSVGVQGDGRTYGHPIVLRPVSSEDAMTADWTRVPYDVLAKISNRITNEVEGVNRVVLDVTSKPPGTIEWE